MADGSSDELQRRVVEARLRLRERFLARMKQTPAVADVEPLGSGPPTWKGAKWILGIEFTRADRLGFWEQRGYSNTAHPWRNDRYAR